MTAKIQQAGSRKRRAPFSQDKFQDTRNSPSPDLAQIPLQQPDQVLNNAANYGDYPNSSGMSYGYNGNMPINIPASPSSQALTRMQPDSQLRTMTAYTNNNTVDYQGRTDQGQMPAPTDDQWQAPYDDLNQRATVAQRDAHSKRKQIPPFIQKLSSFLNENTQRDDLIRWSNDGDSFIVVDEDEFAKSLIPELFKHNNYASFVRQLNMYGFHKKVGLSDNSMRASERKNKNPSEYSNPYFKRGRPNLLWLIHKPKNAPKQGGAKAKQEDVEDEGDDVYNRDSPGPANYGGIEDGMGPQNARQPLMLGSATMNTIPSDQFAALQRELAEVRHNQNEITKMLNFTRQEQYKQAREFHEQHTKHDSAINAILTFLATVYKKNLGERGLGMDNMFGPNVLPSRDQGQGNIVDIGDDKDSNLPANTQMQPYRRPPLLLKDGSANSPAKPADSPQSYKQWPTGGKNFYNHPSKSQSLQSPAIQELDRTSSNRSSESPPIKPNETFDAQNQEVDILSMINSANANNLNDFKGGHMRFPEALSHLQNANGQVTPDQHQNMLQLISNASPNSSNALASFSPNSTSMPDFTQEQIAQISRSLDEQRQRMANLNATIAPLSPSGSIPGVDDQSYNPPNGSELDLDSIFNSNDYFNDGNNPGNFDFSNGNAELPDFDFDTAPVEGQDNADTKNDQGSVVETMGSSEATSPANTVADWGEKERGDVSPRKLRKRN